MELVIKQRNTPEWREKAIQAAKITIAKYEVILDAKTISEAVEAANFFGISACRYCQVFREIESHKPGSCKLCPQHSEYTTKPNDWMGPSTRTTTCTDHVTYKEVIRLLRHVRDLDESKSNIEAGALIQLKKKIKARIGYHRSTITRLSKI